MADASTPSNDPRPIFEPFAWHGLRGAEAAPDLRTVADFASEVHDMTRGVALVLEMLERDALLASHNDDRSPGEAPEALMFNANVRGGLHRFCVASVRLVGRRAMEQVELAEAQAARVAAAAG